MNSLARYAAVLRVFFSKLGVKIWNHRFELLLYILIWGNLYYMHNEVYISHNNYTFTDGYTPFYFMCYDIIVTILFFEILTLGRRKAAFSLAFLFLFFFIVSNVVYSRFLGQYLPLYALTETDNFHGTWWVPYICEAFRWKDLTIAFSILCSVILIIKLPNRRSWHSPIHSIILFFIVSLVYVYKASRMEHVSLRSYTELSKWHWQTLQFEENRNAAVYLPDATIFNYGIIGGQILLEFVTGQSASRLDDAELSLINDLINQRHSGMEVLADSCRLQGRPDVVLIVLESGMSCAVEECVNGKYVMPTLNALIHDSSTYYNPHMKSNKGAGQSSDAQVSYFLGLIPMKGEFSILRVLKDSVIALPSLLEREGYTTCITIPH